MCRIDATRPAESSPAQLNFFAGPSAGTANGGGVGAGVGRGVAGADGEAGGGGADGDGPTEALGEASELGVGCGDPTADGVAEADGAAVAEDVVGADEGDADDEAAADAVGRAEGETDPTEAVGVDATAGEGGAIVVVCAPHPATSARTQIPATTRRAVSPIAATVPRIRDPRRRPSIRGHRDRSSPDGQPASGSTS
jgi:hypothetical protein